jgi:hypothetical protein
MNKVNVKYISKCTDKDIFCYNKPCFVISYMYNGKMINQYRHFNPQGSLLENIFELSDDVFGWSGLNDFKSLNRINSKEYEFIFS